MTIQRAHEEILKLILAAEGGSEQIDAAVREVGPERTAHLVVDELVNRADLHEIAGPGAAPVDIQFVLAFGGGTVEHVVRAGKSTEHEAGRAAQPHATVESELAELVRTVLGPWRTPEAQTLRIVWHDLEDTERLGGTMHVFPVVKRLVRGTTDRHEDLGELSLRQGSDKWGLHFYTPHYDRHFGPLRDRPLKILELGIGGYGNPASGGGSLRMWKRFFPRSVIYGVDVFDKSPLREQRIHTVEGDLSDAGFLESLGRDLGPFDIVIDDASHGNEDLIAAFKALFPYVRPGGLFAAEDLQTSYWPGYGGSSRELSSATTSMGFLKTLLDGLNHEEREHPEGHRPSQTDLTLTGAHFYPSLAVFEKGVNAEGASASWIPRQKMSYEEMSAVDWGEGLTADHADEAGGQ
ncbi:hypothetical protein [Streptomyces sp. NPDC088757]|uniref:hypothetical protein n=1 Tax=Streptomyces sp. NPDC088757 TaxID=3365889 RepID=UPI003812C08B